MFPVASIYSSFLKDPSKERSERTFITAKGVCNTQRAKLEKGLSMGFLRDALNLGSFGPRYEFHKVFAVVPSDYFIFHRIVNNKGVPAAGVVLRPTWEDWYLSDAFKFNWVKDFLGGSWNAAFVSEDQLNQGVVAHELAHTLGQSREYYAQKDRTEYCRPFNGESSELCHKYQIPRALHARREGGKTVWEFVRHFWSIMNNKGRLKDRWIDRETHQKVFWILSKYGARVDYRVDLFGKTDDFYSKGRKSRKSLFPRTEKKRKAIVISAFYHSKTDHLIKPKTQIGKTDLKTPSFYPRTENTKLPVLFFQLWSEKSLLEEIKRPILKMEMELLFQNGPSKREPFDLSPLRAVFDWPEGVERDRLRLVVLNPKREKIYSFKIPKKKKEGVVKKNTQKRKKTEKKRRR